jgi:glutathione peroxidase
MIHALTWLLFLAPACAAEPPAPAENIDWQALNLRALDGSTFDSAHVEDKVVLVVNVASKCGFTSQYEGLQSLQDSYGPKGFSVLGVPCNQFLGQEPGSPEEIASFCRQTYGVTFPLLEKQAVNGANRTPLYRHLVDSAVGEGNSVKWNFTKFLVDSDGQVLHRYGATSGPEDETLVADIQAALTKKATP